MSTICTNLLTDEAACRQLSRLLSEGGLIAYPTEGVYGLGCIASCETAVRRLIMLKNRDPGQGLIVVARSLEDCGSWLQNLPTSLKDRVCASWPGPVTWVCPATDQCPTWVRGRHSGLAVRVSNHPIVQKLCTLTRAPLISTSANVHGYAPPREAADIINHWGHLLDAIVVGECGSLDSPTAIRDALTLATLRG